MTAYYYGVESKNHLDHIVEEVVRALAPWWHAEFYINRTVRLIKGTLAVETNYGTYEDKLPLKHGVGVSQFDPIGIVEAKRAPEWLKQKVYNIYGYDVDLVKHEDLAFDPRLAVIFCRLFYYVKPGSIPGSLEGQAKYWKKYYNSILGSGSPEKFIGKYFKYVGNFYE